MRASIPYLTIFLLLCACGKTEPIPVNLVHGQEAQLTFDGWLQGVDLEWGYPLQYNLEVIVTMDGDSKYHGSTGSLHGNADISIQGPWEFQLNGSGQLTDSVAGDNAAEFAMEAGKERMLFEVRPPRGARAPGFVNQASGASISIDRLQRAFQAFNDAIEGAEDNPQLEELAGENSSLRFYRDLEGISDFFHPDIIMVSFQEDSLVLESLHQDEDAIHLEYSFSFQEFMRVNPDVVVEELPFEDVETMLTDAVIKVVYRKDNGFPISLVVDFPFEEDCQNHGSHSLNMHFEFNYGEMVGSIPPFFFDNPEAAEDIDPMFDAFWPMIETQLQAIVEEVFLQSEQEGAEEDFSF